MPRLRHALLAALSLAGIATGYALYVKQQNAAAEREQQRDTDLRRDLTMMRNAIRSFHAENGRYPKTLRELVPKQLPAIPVDPFTGSNETWRVTTEDVVSPREDFTGSTPQTISYIVDVHSGAGAPWSDY